VTAPASHQTLAELFDDAGFHARHIGPSADERAKMLAALGLASIDELIGETVPATIRLTDALAIDGPRSEASALALLRSVADRNEVFTSLIGMGYSGTITPPVILRNILENPAWYTAYTPYQPEISQGRLEALLNYQTMVADLCGMDIANASMLDEGTAAAEAMTMLRRVGKHAAARCFVDRGCHPQTIAVIAQRAEPLGIEIVIGDPSALEPATADVFAVILQEPATTGALHDRTDLIAAVHEAGGLVVVAGDLLAMVLTTPPGAQGADVVVGTSQRFGVPFGYGGPHAAFLATRERFARSMPGRLVGVSKDTQGRPAMRLALQTREQHIRREKATSNICTAQVLLAVMAGMYAVHHGPDGLRRIAQRVHVLTSAFAAALRAGGVEVVNTTWFDTLTVAVPGRASQIHTAARARRINLREVDGDHVGISFDETSSVHLLSTLGEVFGVTVDPSTFDAAAGGIPTDLRRTGELLTHPVFHTYRSEHDLLRYLRRLADRDLALDRTMIPLGSCTMKLNATTETIPMPWPELAQIHPFAPADQTDGYRQIVADLEQWLAEATGYDAVSLQPNAGSQGELAGLLAIRAYHRSRGDHDRDVCLIPSSAHGTNAASAVMAGMRVVVVACDSDGNVDLTDLRAKADQHGARLAALMVTYPSTHGVFEEAIGEICALVHDHGGQVYVDGANLNALVGLAKPGRFGADVSHLNLHKTFCIPHGGGGPGVGPIGVRAHLAPFLPGHPLAAPGGQPVGPISAAPFGSAGILPIPWMYIAMMGGEGLALATRVAILNANYIASRLAPHYPVLYTGANGRVAHECIIDIRPIQKATGISNDDIAKRLMDYGFHAPTMSFPVNGTLMIEPTESESLGEIERFCQAMISIRTEITKVERGEWPADDNPLVHAPHTAEDVATDAWDRAYTRDLAAFPVPSLRGAKYWPPVSRIDAASGDRNLVCSCPPLSEYALD
jgi:glycine dehydrogenase